jgi:hypothetical protein
VTRGERAEFTRRARPEDVDRVGAVVHTAMVTWWPWCATEAELHAAMAGAADLEIIATPGWERLIGRPAEAA